MAILLLFDTETTGLIPRRTELRRDTIHLFPYAVQISFLLFDDATHAIEEMHDFVVQLPDHVDIPEEASKIHGITTAEMRRVGVPFAQVMDVMLRCLRRADRVVAHNVEFDHRIIQVELARRAFEVSGVMDVVDVEANTPRCFRQRLHEWCTFPQWYCTMQSMTDVCQIRAQTPRGKSYWKFPKLSELHAYLFGEVPHHLHNAMCDVLVTLRCYVWMQQQVDLRQCSATFREAVAFAGVY